MDHMVEAVYTPYTTVLASAAMRDGVHPVFLLEGVFDGQARLEARLPLPLLFRSLRFSSLSPPPPALTPGHRCGKIV